MSIAQLIPTFNAGELSPYLDARSDIEKYASGCRLLENFVIMPYGGVYRRPGTEYLGRAKLAHKRCRLVPFNFSITTRFVLELGERYIRFWSNGLQVEKSSADDWVTAHAYAVGAYVTFGQAIYLCLAAHTSDLFANDLAAGHWVEQTAVEVASPYVEAELRDVQYLQINDVMYLVHPAHAPQKLSRLADDEWTLAEVAWDWPALLDENVSSLTLTPSATTGTNIALTGSAPAWATSTTYGKGDFVSHSGSIYQALSRHTSGSTFGDDLALWETYKFLSDDHVGSYWQIAHARETAFIALNITTNHASSALKVLGSWDFTTYGNWTATVLIERSTNGGASWETIRSYSGENNRNVTASGKESTEVLLRIRTIDYSTGNTNPRALLQASEAKDFGIVKITDVAEDGLAATAEVVNDLFSNNATSAWSEGAWSVKRGFPRSVALHEQRIYYGGTKDRPDSIWGSAIDDFENFRESANDDAGLFFTLSAQEANPIQWMTSQDRLLIGTAGEEWTLGSSDANSTITPSNVQAVRQSSYGSKSLRAMVVNEVILFVQRQGRKVRELVYSFEKDGWVAPDLTMLAEHVTRGEILECAFQQQPDAIYWTVTGAGQLAGMTYERDQNVVGWHRHTTDGAFESVASVYGASGADEVWVAVRRVINGETVRYIERFKVNFRETFEAEDKADWWYLDCARRGSGSGHAKRNFSLIVTDLLWHAMPSQKAISLAFTNTTGVEITLRANGVETVVPPGGNITISSLTDTSEVEYKASSYGTLLFEDVAFHYGDSAVATEALSLAVAVTGDIDSGAPLALDTGWTLTHLHLDTDHNKIDELGFARDEICAWGYNYLGPITIPHIENEYPEAGEQTLSVDPDGFTGDHPLYYDESDDFDLSYYSYIDPGTNDVRTSSGTVRYLAAQDLLFEYEISEAYVFSGLEHLEGKTVDLLADAAVSPARTVAGGQITLQGPATMVLAGLPYVSQLRPMKSEMSLADGTTRSRKKRINRVAVSVYKSLGGEVSTNGTDWSWITTRSFTDTMDSSPPVFTGDREVIVAGASGPSVDVTIRQAQPLPLTVLSAVVKYDAHGD